MLIEAKRTYLEKIRVRYQKASRKRKSLILDEFCEVCDYSRKHAIRVLNNEIKKNGTRPGPKYKYGPEVREHLVYIWEAMGRICSKKMVEALRIWLPFYSNTSAEGKILLSQISASTIDRVIKKEREKQQYGRSLTKACLLKNMIPIKLLDHQITEPGFIEADTVAHCGTSMAGEFANTLTMTDIYSSWTENRAVFKKDSGVVLEAIKSIETSLPFYVLGFASDNGNEFFNYDLHNYFYKREEPVEFVRRRPYQKNDNAHVEQKNWTHVRKLFGYDRFDEQSQVDWMNDIYKRLWNPLWNFFIPVMKLKEKTRHGGKIVKVYDRPKTPYQRLMESKKLSPYQQELLKNTYEGLNPFQLRKELEEKLKWFFRIAELKKQSLSVAA